MQKEKDGSLQAAPVVPAAFNSQQKDEPSASHLLQIPSIAQPKGGGALKSIDEKFQVNAANGTASISISIPFSPSRSDFTPQLTLAYNSGSGNSAFGLGWDISLPSIRRRTDKMIPRYQDAEESDIFQMTGAEDLVPALVRDATGAWIGDSFSSGGRIVKRYHPRIESGFTLIEKISDGDDTYWKTTTGSNTVVFYGLTPQGRIADPADASHIFEWFPEIAYDDKGNCYQYFYQPEDAVNVPVLPHENNRLHKL